MTALARAIGIRSLHVEAADARDFATAYALLLALRTAIVALSSVEKLAYLIWLESQVATPTIPVSSDLSRVAGNDAS